MMKEPKSKFMFVFPKTNKKIKIKNQITTKKTTSNMLLTRRTYLHSEFFLWLFNLRFYVLFCELSQTKQDGQHTGWYT